LTITLYGIPNCDTVKKARDWLTSRGIAYSFHDYKKAGWEKVLNQSGTTFRKLPDSDKLNLDVTKAVALMAANPSSIKRPVLEYPGGLLIGFKSEEWTVAIA
jgi:arsenate reductase